MKKFVALIITLLIANTSFAQGWYPSPSYNQHHYDGNEHHHHSHHSEYYYNSPQYYVEPTVVYSPVPNSSYTVVAPTRNQTIIYSTNQPTNGIIYNLPLNSKSIIVDGIQYYEYGGKFYQETPYGYFINVRRPY